MNRIARSLISGLAGASTLTALHEGARRIFPEAPRMDILGMRALARLLRKAGVTPPAAEKLHRSALVGDLISNSLYYSLVGLGGQRSRWWLGSLLGLAAGVGAVVLPGPLRLGTRPSQRTAKTAVLTVAYYLFGGLVAAAVARLLDDTLAAAHPTAPAPFGHRGHQTWAAEPSSPSTHSTRPEVAEPSSLSTHSTRHETQEFAAGMAADGIAALPTAVIPHQARTAGRVN